MSSLLSAVFLTFCCVLVAIRPSSAQQDLTLVPEASGTDVTTASVDLITISGVFPTDNRFLRRVAYVETRDGVDLNTYREGYNGGIWQVDEGIFNETLDVDAHPELIDIYGRILNAFGVDWSAARWVDLRRPFFSALAARIFFETVDEPIPRTGDLIGQAEFWKQHFNSDPADTLDQFITAVNELELEGCPVQGLDLAFVFDSSGSVGEQNFELEKDYAVNVVEQFTTGPEDTQIAAIAYSGFARISFFLNTFRNQTVISQALRDIEYFDIPGQGRPSTNTAQALERLRNEVFTPEGGARDKIFGIPRVAVVLTDGRSNVNRSQTIPNAQALHNDSVVVFAVGVGNRVSQAEINGIASAPEYVINIRSFDVTEFVGLQRTISAEACVVPAPVNIEQAIEATLGGGRVSFFQFQVPGDGMTIQLQQEAGKVTLYTSTTIRNPNSAFYDEKIEGEGAVFISPNKTSEDKMKVKRAADDVFTEIIVYVSIEGQEEVNQFVLNTTFGNTVSPASSAAAWRLPVIVSLVSVVVVTLCVVLTLVIVYAVVKITRNKNLKSTQGTGMQASREMLTQPSSAGDGFMHELANKQVFLKGQGVITGSGHHDYNFVKPGQV